jgi:hypothetical protein
MGSHSGQLIPWDRLIMVHVDEKRQHGAPFVASDSAAGQLQ